MIIDVNTKIAAILKHHPDAIEAIIEISPKFNKLRNPLLRKLVASRTTISMASKIGGCSTDDFFNKLEPLGFKINRLSSATITEVESPRPAFMDNINKDNTAELDVRQWVEVGKDPLLPIMEQIKKVQPGNNLKLINSFEPIPLIELLKKQGFISHTEIIDENTVFTYFHNTSTKVLKTEPSKQEVGWDEKLAEYSQQLTTIDVRELEMPLPMLTILDELEKLPKEKALYVYHKRIPVFLLPELKERKFDYRIKEISDSEVHLLIFKP